MRALVFYTLCLPLSLCFSLWILTTPGGKRFVPKMLKISNHLANSSLVLVRKQLADGRTAAAFILMRSPKRQYGLGAESHFKETCPPPSPKKPSRRLLYATIGATVLAGSAIVYAKHSPETRNWIETNAPWAHNIVAIVYQEHETYWEFTSKQAYKIYTSISNFMFGREGVPPMQFKPRSEQDLEKDAVEGFKAPSYKLPPPALVPLYIEEKVMEPPSVEMEATLVQTEECEPEKPKEYKVTKYDVELENTMSHDTKVAIDNYQKALKFAQEYNKILCRIIELPYDCKDSRLFAQLKAVQASRDDHIKKAQEAFQKASCAIETLDRMITQGKLQAPPENLAMTKRYTKQFRDDITAASEALRVEIERGNVSEKYWNRVEEARCMYKEELQTLFPGIDLTANKLKISGDTDLLLCYTIKQVQFLQNELAQLETIADQKIARAVECNDQKLIIEAKAEHMARQERIKLEFEYLKKALKMEAEFSKKFKEQLTKQYEMQEEITRSRLDKKEKEIMGRMNRAVSEQVEKERVKFKKELAAMAGKLQAIEQTLKKRAAAEQEARRSQSVWAAAEGLLAATRRPIAQTKIDNELKALEKAGQGDKMVQTILKGIPKEVRDEGIATEMSLKDRFDLLEQTTMKVALIGRDGASLPMYFLSWVQSKLLFQKLAEIPRDELDNLPQDFSKLDTFDIMQRARYYMDRGNLPAALRYVNLLQGAPRAAAMCWVQDARRHLEIRQAAETVMAHASLAGINSASQ